MEGLSEIIMTREKTTKYKMAMERKIPAVKIGGGKNDKILIRIPYNHELRKKIKTISGRRWNPRGKYWEVPYEEGLMAKRPRFITMSTSADINELGEMHLLNLKKAHIKINIFLISGGIFNEKEI